MPDRSVDGVHFLEGCLTKVVVHFPDPRQPTRYCSTLERQWKTTDNDHDDTRIVFKGTIHCLDYQTLEAIQARLSTDLTLSTHLLCSTFDLSLTKTPFAMVIDMALSDEYLNRGCRLSNLSWSRRMWAVASRANLLAFTSVFYSVLGGAYSSLSKANANYVSCDHIDWIHVDIDVGGCRHTKLDRWHINKSSWLNGSRTLFSNPNAGFTLRRT